ncbi:sodium-dependent glucose transporter 1-like [Tetranychus urticae]|uniref:Major facilitator superfamily (MFS) profile domain-containing protein n=1 Tax=Tetranychus urticae TaxID=32264 RepID=T1L4M8_TETUR|nr:sodium-dependent glucose transporter 1-like [Tetranychus urticae]
MDTKVNLVDYVKVNKFKLFQSLLCFASYAGLGSVITLLGTSLLDYQILTSQSFQTIVYLVQIRSVGYILGSISAHFIEKYFNQILILTISNFVLGCALIATPFFENIIGLFIATLVIGITFGILEIYVHVYIGFLWKSKSTNYLQALHMFFDIGALVSPLITRPFLLPLDPDEYNAQSNQTSVNLTEVKIYTKNDLLIQYPHAIMGLFLVLVGFLFTVTLFTKDCPKQDAEHETDQSSNQILNWKHRVAIVVTALIVNFEFGAQNLVSALGPAFVVKSNLKMTKQEAALLITVYWSSCGIYRLIMIPAAVYFKESSLIIFNAAIMVCGAAVMGYTGDSNQTLIWVSFILMSLGFSPSFAFAFGFIQKYFTVQSSMASLMFLCGTLGESIHPWIVSVFMESWSAFYSLYFALIAIINALLCIFLVFFVTKFIKKVPNLRDEYQEM